MAQLSRSAFAACPRRMPSPYERIEVTYRFPFVLRNATMFVTIAVLTGGCAASGPAPSAALPALPATEDFCLAAQKLVVHTTIPMKNVVHDNIDGFVKSKAVIEGPTIQQFNWSDGQGRLLGISCKLKNAEHLIATFGADSAGPEGACQDVNRAVYALVMRDVRKPAYREVRFDPAESAFNEKTTGMTGPDWLLPFTLTSVDPDGALRIHTKGFITGFADPQLAQVPVRFRGVHYCHFIAPEHLRDLLEGKAKAGVQIGHKVVNLDPNAMTR